MDSLHDDNCYDCMRTRGIVPPTTNALSRAERARLLRSSNKIARVLGATPRYLDDAGGLISGYPSPLANDLTAFDDTHCNANYLTALDHRNSIDSVSSSSTTSSTSTALTSISSSSTHSLRRLRKPLPLQDIWPAPKRFRPKLSLSTPLESIPASPLTPEPMSRSIPLAASSIPTHSAARRRKLDRLRRTLGDDVPVSLILPQTTTEESDTASDSSSASSSDSDSLTTPDTSPVSSLESPSPSPSSNRDPAQRHPRKKRIANTRDSLLVLSKLPAAAASSSSLEVAYAPPLPSKPPGLYPTTTARRPFVILGSRPTSTPIPTSAPPSPAVHRRSLSQSSTSTSTAALGVIPEEKGASGWYESDSEDFIRDDEVLGAECRLDNGDAKVLYGRPVGKGMGRGLARSYATATAAGW